MVSVGDLIRRLFALLAVLLSFAAPAVWLITWLRLISRTF
jgi:hypothetical protein